MSSNITNAEIEQAQKVYITAVEDTTVHYDEVLKLREEYLSLVRSKRG